MEAKVIDIREILSKDFNYPDTHQTAVWFPFFNEPSFEPRARSNCQSYLIYDRGSIK